MSDLIDRVHARCVEDGDCLVWTGADQKRYGIISSGGRKNRKNHYVHRVAYEHAFGEIPEGYEVHHSCENPLCVNTDHLLAVDGREHRRQHHSPLAVSRDVLCPRCGTDRWKQGFWHGRKNGWNCMNCRARRAREGVRRHH